MSTFISPGVYTRELDFSLYARELATSVFGVVGTAPKGPTDEITLITDEASLVNIFGTPTVDDLGMLCAIRYLRWGNQLKFMRVATYDAIANGTIRGRVIAGGAISAAGTFVAPSSGSWGNVVTVTIVASTYYPATYKITVLENSIAREVFDNCVIGTPADDNYWVTKINAGSDYIQITAATVDDTQLLLEAETRSLSGGVDGSPADNSDIIGVAGSPPVVATTGLQLFRNAETIDVNLLAVPDSADTEIIAELINICETRGDCMALLAVPSGKSVQQAVDWHNGTGGGAGEPAAALNSSYAALYYPWVTVYDGNSDSQIDIPPIGHAAGVMALTDRVRDPWFAPAGLQRGKLSDVLAIEHSPTQGERDFMYGGTNCVNPLVNFVADGITIWGQRNLQRTSTSADRINIRRLLLYARKIVASSVRYLIMEPNDEITWRQFVGLVNQVFDSIKARRGVYDFRVICDSTTNTPATIARNEMHGKVLLQPTRTAEMITVDFVLLPTGASFDEFV